MRPHTCLVLKTRTRSVALSEHGKAYRRAIGARLTVVLRRIRIRAARTYGGGHRRGRICSLSPDFTQEGRLLAIGGQLAGCTFWAFPQESDNLRCLCLQCCRKCSFKTVMNELTGPRGEDMQFGSLIRRARRSQSAVWEFIWREPGPKVPGVTAESSWVQPIRFPARQPREKP
jgi:hypothetical protein